jgi:ATP-dependent Clp protease adaptor protein ClpS
LQRGPTECSNRETDSQMQSATATPVLKPQTDDSEQAGRSSLYHVVLLDDDEHTYDYVVEMLQKLFLLPEHLAFQHAVEVDTTGRTVVITCELPEAEFARDQIQSYGADPRMPKSKGSMSAVLVPAGDTATE